MSPPPQSCLKVAISFLVRILGTWGVWFGSDPRKSNGEVKIHITGACVFVLSLVCFLDGPETLPAVWSQHFWVPPQVTHTPTGIYFVFSQNYSSSLFLKLNHSITWHCWNSNVWKVPCFPSFFPACFFLYSFDPQTPSIPVRTFFALAVSSNFKSHLKFHLKPGPLPVFLTHFSPGCHLFNFIVTFTNSVKTSEVTVLMKHTWFYCIITFFPRENISRKEQWRIVFFQIGKINDKIMETL